MFVRVCLCEGALPVYSAESSLEEIQKKHFDEPVVRADSAEFSQSKRGTVQAGRRESESERGHTSVNA